MINRVVLTGRARKDLARAPRYIVNKLDIWIDSVERTGLENVRRLPGFHDEPLKGKRAGQRSIRLNIAWRYLRGSGGRQVNFVSIEEVTHHAY